MTYPEFFDMVPAIRVHDPLSALLGTFAAGNVTFSYLDVVKAAGHSCPTVAGAYLMALRGLEALYPETLPVRGNIRVLIKEALEAGSAGVTGSVLSQITGAAEAGGFKGMNGRFARRDLLEYGAAIEADLRLVRLDDGRAVDCYYTPQSVPPAAELQPLMLKIGSGDATMQQLMAFGRLWQERVREILIEARENENLVRIEVV